VSAVQGLRKVPVLNAANILTALRIVLVPVFVILVIVSGMTDTYAMRLWREISQLPHANGAQ